MPTNTRTMLTFHLYEDNYLLEEIDKIIKERWRTIGRTTTYGWLTAYSYRKTISQDDERVLAALADKVGLENCNVAIERIRKILEHLHPNDIPAVAVAILNETYIAIMFKQRRQSKSSMKPVKNQFPTVFTISGTYCVPRSI